MKSFIIDTRDKRKNRGIIFISMDNINIELTNKLINELNLKIPIDLNQLIDSFTDIQIEYETNISKNILTKKVDNGYLIQMRNKQFDLTDPKGYEDRFTIAHELGHLFLGHVDYYKNLYRRGANELEYDALDFGANLLMPKSEFIESVYANLDEDGYCDLNSLSEYFRVPLSAVKTRGKFLGIFPW